MFLPFKMSLLINLIYPQCNLTILAEVKRCASSLLLYILSFVLLCDSFVMCEQYKTLFSGPLWYNFPKKKLRRHTSRMEASVIVSELFAGSLCGLLAQGWVNLSGESWDFAESSVPFLISVVVAKVFMFTTGQLNICPPPSFLLQAKCSQTLVLSWVCVVPFQFHVSATMWERDADVYYTT